MAAGPADLPAQTVSVAAGRHLGTPSRTQWTVGYMAWEAGPADATVLASSLDGRDGQRHWMGLELGLLRRTAFRFHASVAGFAGVGSRGASALSVGWSAGAGYDLIRAGPLGLAAEGRYLAPSDGPGTVSLGIRLGVRVGGATRARGTSPALPPGAAPGPVAAIPAEERAARVQAVVHTAREVMSTPYVWGGADQNGFDCSGLIQYAYRAHGILLPRRSADQAREGLEVGRDPFALEPGDILTFVIAGSTVSHVGLYLGEGRFIHSGSRGVEISALRPADPVGRYWWDRWVGARRVIP